MRMTIDRANLNDKLPLVTSAAGKSTRTELTCVYVDVSGDHATFEANDTEVGAGARFEVTDAEDGACLLPIDRLIKMVKESDATSLQLEVVPDTAIRLSLGRAKFVEGWLPPGPFPRWQVEDAAHRLTLNAGQVVEAIRLVDFTINEKETTSLRGILWEFSDGILTLVAADGRRLSAKRIPCDYPQFAEINAHAPLISVNAARMVAKALNNCEGDAEIAISASQIRFAAGNVWTAGRLLEGQYPNWKRLDSMEGPLKTKINSKELSRALRQCEIVTDLITRKAICTFKPGVLTIVSRGVAGSESTIDVATDYAGEEATLAIDPSLITEMLAKMSGLNEVEVIFAPYKNPVFFQMRPDYRYLVQPMKM